MAASVLRFNSPLDSAFFGGSAASTLTPKPFPIAVDGRPYQVMWDHDAIGVWGARFKRNSLQLLRSQADQSNIPGEQSISPENFWRRSQENFVSGAGQLQQDRGTSVGTRFYTSKGIDPWTPYALTLLNSVANKRTSTNTGLLAVVNGTSVYLIDGSNVVYSTDSMASWTTVTGGPATAATSICSDGYSVYTAHGSNGTYVMTAGTMAQYNTGQADVVAYVKGRLMVAGGTAIYNPTASGALPAALMTKNTGFTWVGFAGGQTQIYAAGYSGDKSLIYRIAIVADGTTLSAPIPAGELPDGEIVRSISSYLGYILIGSDLGIRLATVASDGSLTIGSLIQTTSPVYCAQGQDRFVWYGLTNYDSVSTGLGRMDLTNFPVSSVLAPAYATDLMATGQGAVKSVGTLNKARLFTVDGVGIFLETLATPVSTGVLTSGWISYDISDPKVAVFLDLKHDPLHGTISVSFAADGAAMVTLGTSATQGTASPGVPFQTNQVRGLQFQIQFTLTPTANVAPVLTRWTLRSYPAPSRSTQFQVPIILWPLVKIEDTEYQFDVVAERKHLEALLDSQQVISYQQGNDTYQVVMADYDWLPQSITANGDVQGVFLAYFNEITG